MSGQEHSFLRIFINKREQMGTRQPAFWRITPAYLNFSSVKLHLGLEGTLETLKFQPPAAGKVANPYIRQQFRMPRASYSLALHVSRDVASTVTLSSLCQHLTILPVKSFP